MRASGWHDTLLDPSVAAALVDACPVAFVAVDPSFRVIAWNPAAEQLFGWRAEDVLGAEAPHLSDADAAALKAEGTRERDAPPRTTTGRRKDGSEVTIVVECETEIRAADGTVVGWGRFLREAGVEAHLLARRNALSRAFSGAVRRDEVLAVLEAAVAELLCVDGGFVIRHEGGRLRAAHGLGSRRHTAVAALSGVDRTASAELARGHVLLDGGGELEVALVAMGPEGAGQVLALCDGALGERMHVPTAVALAAEAWSALRRVETVAELEAKVEALEASAAVAHSAVERLEAVDRARADYVAGIIHDLQAPLTGLLGFVGTLRRIGEGLGAEERAEYLDAMQRQVRRVAGLVEDMLVGARLESGDLQPDEPEDVDLAILAAETPALFGPEQRRRVRVDAPAPVVVRADRHQLERVLQNLVDNALKHSPQGAPVEVGVARERGWARLSVRDEGPGIPQEARSRVFGRYGRAGGPRRGSTGLGLYIVRGIVEAHGGEVGLESAAGRGAVFVVRLPLATSG